MTSRRTIDLRSDTVTQPTAGMRAVIAAAPVGDDVYGEDPSVIALQERVADLLGTEAALWMPTGTMANQVALRAHTQPGDEVIIGKNAHCWLFESGALAALAGAQTQVMPGDGRFTAADVRAAFRPLSFNMAPTRVVTVENTHNQAGGLVWNAEELLAVTSAAHELGMRTHLDGARLWNAAVATGKSERELARGFDSISICLSKGLGAPAGSVVAGSRDFIQACLRFRKMYGGGLRQAGLFAAAGMYAIEHHRAGLAADHARAKQLAALLASVPGLIVDAASVITNIVMIDLDDSVASDAAAISAAAKQHGLRIGAAGTRRLRAVTHLDIIDEDIPRAAVVLTELVAARR